MHGYMHTGLCAWGGAVKFTNRPKRNKTKKETVLKFDYLGVCKT